MPLAGLGSSRARTDGRRRGHRARASGSATSGLRLLPRRRCTGSRCSPTSPSPCRGIKYPAWLAGRRLPRPLPGARRRGWPRVGAPPRWGCPRPSAGRSWRGWRPRSCAARVSSGSRGSSLGYTQHVAARAAARRARRRDAGRRCGCWRSTAAARGRALPRAPAGPRAARRRPALLALGLAAPAAWLRARRGGPPPGAAARWWRWCRATSRARSSGAASTRTQILAKFLALSPGRAVARRGRAFVVWPETATGQLPAPATSTSARRSQDFVDSAGRAGLRRLSRLPAAATPTRYRLVERGRRVLARRAGSRRATPRCHLVPFGERMPFQWLVPGARQARPRPGRVDAGRRTRCCSDARGAGRGAWSASSRSSPTSRAPTCARGARWLVNITNDEWFGNSAALYQHAAMAVFRAVENARAAGALRQHRADLLHRPARPRSSRSAPVFDGPRGRSAPCRRRPGAPTPFTRFGDWPGALAAGAVRRSRSPRAARAARALTAARGRVATHAACRLARPRPRSPERPRRDASPGSR